MSKPIRSEDGTANSPVFPDDVLKLCMLRDLHGLGFGRIGNMLGISRAGAAKQYARWIDWATQQQAFKDRRAELKKKH